MSKSKTQDLLKKINYIEADIEIQKQILFSIPSDKPEEMEKTIQIIANKNKEIQALREQIKVIDPVEYERIITFEEAINNFKKLAAKKQFESITNKNIGEDCYLFLKNGNKEECLIKACDDKGDWAVITLDGELKEYTKSEVQDETPPEQQVNN